MLQQTQVQTVRSRFYEPFLKRFPTVGALAIAQEAEVMKAWEGLGYYRRARHLHRAAQMVAPTMPATVEGLKAMPGVGQSTAHAIAAFAYHQPVPILDANLRRVLARYFALIHPKEATWWQAAWDLLDRKNPYNYNQALMDIGAMLCTPRQPRCTDCPLYHGCRGKESPETYPGAKQRKPAPVRQQDWVVMFRADGRFALWRRKGEHLTGLYGVMRRSAEDETPLPKQRKLLGGINQTYSHYVLDATVWQASADTCQAHPEFRWDEAIWVTPEEATDLPLSRAEQKLLQLMK
jgi:A/G-specific adenine glycosylase